MAGAVCMSSLSLIGWTLLWKNLLHLFKSIIDRVQCSWHGDGALFNTKKGCTLKILSLPAPAVVDTAVRWPKISYLRSAKNCFIALFGLRQYTVIHSSLLSCSLKSSTILVMTTQIAITRYRGNDIRQNNLCGRCCHFHHYPSSLLGLFFSKLQSPGIVGTITGTILSIVAIVQCFRVAGSCS